MKLIIDVPEPTGAYLRAVAAAWHTEGHDDFVMDTPDEATVAEHLIESALLEDHVLDEKSQTWVQRGDDARPDIDHLRGHLTIHRLRPVR